MSRYTAADDSLRISVDDVSVEPCAIAVARALSRLGERKIYFMSFVPLQYAMLKRFKGVALTFLSSGQTPPDLTRSARMIHSKSELVVASPKLVRKDQWAKVGADVEGELAKGPAA
ncbi:MAG TPA: hypothetical protein VFE23_05260 [Usitatibacter sp.]|jgi:hypothetical protein|nr:hypothetical protein [Usitatibacter sp.]